MRIAFYAPLKAPDDPTPSGDRLIARMLMAALAAGGHDVELASRLRSFDRDGDRRPGAGTAGITVLQPSRQQRLHQLANRISQRLIRRWLMRPASRRPDLWFTYHLYHKAPDWIGPRVATAFGIPYVVAEASVTSRQADGPWAYGHGGVQRALAQADLVVMLNPKDEAGVRTALRPVTPVLSLAPFIDTEPFVAATERRQALRTQLAAAHGLDPALPWLVTVGMMRADVKRESFRVLAQALEPLASGAWQLLVAGDGDAAEEIRRSFAPLSEQVRFLGRLEPPAIVELLAAGDLFVWPAIGEAIGMVFLEAQAAGLPVIGANRPGVASVVVHGVTGLLPPEGDVTALTAAITFLLAQADKRQQFGNAGKSRAREEHDLKVATRRLCAALEALRCV